MSVSEIPPSAEHLFEQNLRALALVDTELAQILSAETGSFFFKNVATTSHLYAIELMHRGSIISLPQEELLPWSAFLDLQRSMSTSTPRFRLGIGSGRGLLEDLQATNATVTVLEKHPAWIRYFLSRFEVSDLLRSGQIRIEIPFLFLLRSTNKERSQTVDWSYDTISQHLYHDLLHSTQPFQDSKSHLDVIIDGALVIDDLSASLRDEGRNNLIFSPNLYPIEWVKRFLASERIDIIWAINRSDKLVQHLADCDAPFLIHEIDPDLSSIPSISASKNIHLFTYRTSRKEAYQQAGWQSSFLPLGSYTKRFTGVQKQSEYACNISFVGSSIFSNAIHLRHELLDGLTPRQHVIWDEFWERQKSELFNYLAPEYAQQLEEADEGNLMPILHQKGLNLTSILSEWSGACHRVGVVSSVAHFGLDVWGDAQWNTIAQHVPGMRYRGPAGHQTMIPQIYASSSINLDVTRSYQADVATLRLFDVLAGGNVCITNYDDSHYRLFEPPGLLTFHTLEGLQVLCEEVLRWPAHVRNAYTAHMQAQTIQNHDLSQRVSKMRARK